MDIINIYIIVGSVLFILILWTIVGTRHLKSLTKAIGEIWEEVEEKVRKRQDLIPSLIETVRIYVKDQQKILDQLIAERAVAAKEHIADASKIEYEHDLSSTLNKVFDFSTVSKDLSVDTNFLELKGEIRQVERDIEFKVRQYNDTVRYYNKHRNIFFLWPIAKIFGYKPENVFEVEM